MKNYTQTHTHTSSKSWEKCDNKKVGHKANTLCRNPRCKLPKLRQAERLMVVKMVIAKISGRLNFLCNANDSVSMEPLTPLELCLPCL